MPQDLRIRVGVEVAQITFGGTPQQVAAALTRFATSLGIAINGTPTENLTAILEHMRDDVKRRSKAVQIASDLAVAQVAIEATAETENPL